MEIELIETPPPLAGGGELLAHGESNSGEGASTSHEPPPPSSRANALELAPSREGRGSSDRVGDIIRIARSWIGTAYVHQASLKGVGCDCLGLLRGIWRELHGEEPEAIPPYSADWAEATGAETLYMALTRHGSEMPLAQLAPGDIALFRMTPHGPAKHCGVIATSPQGEGGSLTLIHARQNERVSEEPLSPFWRGKLAYVFRL